MANDPTLNDFAHTWKHSYKDRYGNPCYEITVTSYNQVTDELVEDFATYLMGCGFHQSNIIEAFEAYISQYSSVVNKGNADEQTLPD